MALVTPAPLRAQKQPEPQFFTCIMTWMVLGIFVCCAITCYMNGMNAGDYSGPTNAPPILPPEEPMPPTNSIPTNLPPDITVFGAPQHLDVSASNWTDSAGAKVTDLYRTTIQSAGDPRGPWTNAYVVTHWASAYGSTAIVEDGSGNPLMTNFALRVGGNVTNRLPVELDRSAPQKFYRAN